MIFARGHAENCHRCLQPVPSSSGRCPHCGDRLSVGARKLSLYFAAAGLIAIVGIVVLALYIKTPSTDPVNEDGQESSAPKAPQKPVLD